MLLGRTLEKLAKCNVELLVYWYKTGLDQHIENVEYKQC